MSDDNMKQYYAAGFTVDEADAMEQLRHAASRILDLPPQHPLEQQEVVAAIHVLQVRLFARPAYREYLKAGNLPETGWWGHEFKGRLDRDCEICGKPDRNAIHKPEHEGHKPVQR